MKNIFTYDTDIGKIGIAEENMRISNVFFEQNIPASGFNEFESDTIKNAYRQLDAYLRGELKTFSLDLAPAGTEYMKKVWKQLCNIPYGKTASYKQIAEASGNSKASRAVGLANNKNPIPIFIPCHRVIGSNGKLTGYRGGLGLKEKLLKLEKQNAVL